MGNREDRQLCAAAADHCPDERRGWQAANGVRARPPARPRRAPPGTPARTSHTRLGVCGRLGDADDAVFADTNSKQKGGTVAKVTKGMIDRTAYYEHALHLALVPFVHDESTPGLYRDT